jgi:hypothetical protein
LLAAAGPGKEACRGPGRLPLLLRLLLRLAARCCLRHSAGSVNSPCESRRQVQQKCGEHVLNARCLRHSAGSATSPCRPAEQQGVCSSCAGCKVC